MTGPGLSIKQQDSILDADRRLNIWHGSIRSGKTIASILRWLLYVRNAPPGPLAVLGKTKDTIARNVLDVIASMHPAAITYTRGANVCRILGRQVEVIGANDAKAESKIRGLTLAGAYVDEATLFPEAFWSQTLGRLSVPGAKLFATTNPDNPAHWLKKKFLDRAAELDLFAVHFQLDDNPSLDPAYVASLKAEYTGLWYKRFINGLWVAAEGAIYDMLDEDFHTAPAPDPKRWQRAWIAADYGTSNPTHAVLLVLADDRLHAVAEWVHDGRAKGQLTDAAISQRLTAWAGPLVYDRDIPTLAVLDPSAASLRTQMRADGWPGLRSADNRVDVGIRNTASLLAGGRLVIDRERCPVLWDQLCGYVWDEAALQRGEERPVKADDHGPDALRYGVMASAPVWRGWLPDLAADDEFAAAA
ncbi:PBSX family phage terminase large subunit [Amycolatopsis thermophila]|uniref:PBSX family phage terminase large subunit n=1 Tax=Amycolatopsis thermophila TaxID=206084 RepID=A0ABU0ERP0_9PSEU|nr:PBSX family phage terminase large subunit [Amycolatopsis thermophila]MDQ0377942.1 PBSX family phage terminase large subunit [Amycolatopsis thermophila]